MLLVSHDNLGVKYMRSYRFFTAESTHGLIVNVLVDTESFDGNSSDYFVMGNIKGEIEDKGIVEINGPNTDLLPDVLESN
jgi:hypothetical protein